MRTGLFPRSIYLLYLNPVLICLHHKTWDKGIHGYQRKRESFHHVLSIVFHDSLREMDSDPIVSHFIYKFRSVRELTYFLDFVLSRYLPSVDHVFGNHATCLFTSKHLVRFFTRMDALNSGSQIRTGVSAV